MPADNPDEPRVVLHARDSTGQAPALSVVRHLSELARELRAESDPARLLQHIVAATVEEVDGAEQGGISMIEGHKVRAVAPSSATVRRLDQRQNDVGEGPCLNALREQVTIRTDDLRAESRWPRFAGAAVDEGVRSMLSVQLFVDGDNLGALNLYSGQPDAFTTASEYTAMAFAAHAAVAMKGRDVENNLRTALDSRDIIGQGKGILMERFKISSDEAFTLLVMASQQRNRKLRDVADDLATSGDLGIT
ncbi:GAF and ANTAR domain-containing protein [uncultured Jatrophihabitans sp.]|uniref:GAF and ANTAR domain-containing protein n=1 Tax=uncultured Jatrophihabitans sp. TaxID=1610747 RepID=UPI0035CC6C40